MATSLSRKTVGNTTILAAGSALEAAFQVIFLLITGRELGPEEFGFYGYLLALVTLAVTAANFGLSLISVREIVRRPESEDSLFAATFRIRAALSILGFLAAIVVSLFAPLTPAHRMAVWLMFIYLLCVPFDLAFLFDAHQLSRWDVPGRLAGRFVSVAVLVVLWQSKSELSVLDVSLCSSLLMAVNVGTGWWIARRLHLPLAFWGNTTDTRPLIRQSAPILWANLMSLTYSQNQTILVKAFSSAVETGFYALTSRLLMPMLMIKGVLYRVLVPIFSESVRDRSLLTARLEKIIPILALLFLPLATLAIAGADVLLVPLFGSEYSGAVLPFQISMGIFFFSGVGSLFGSVVLASGDARTPTVGLTIGTGIAVGLSVFTIPPYGASGAAVAAGIGEMISIAYAVPKFLRLTRPTLLLRILKISTASIGALLIFYLLRSISGIPALLNFGAAILLTGIGLWLAGEISRDHIHAAWQLIRRPAPVADNSGPALKP